MILPHARQSSYQRRRWCEIGLAVLATLLVACAQPAKKNFIPPDGREANQCLEICRSDRFECRQVVQQDQDACRIRYNYRDDAYRRCVAQRGVQRCIGLKPTPCMTPAYQQCTELYDRCFVGCGGRIE